MLFRRLLRDAAKAALLGQTIAGARIDSGRPNPLSQAPSAREAQTELPRIILYTKQTRSEVFDESPRRYKHEVELTVEATLAVGPSGSVDDALDGFEQQIVAALLLDDTLGGTVNDLKLTGSTNVIDDEGDRMLAAALITFSAEVFMFAPLPETQQLPDLNVIVTQYNVTGDQPEPDRAVTQLEGLSE